MTERTTPLTATSAAELLADTAPYLSCDACFAQLDEYVERTLAVPGHQDVPMQTHLRGCGACAEEAAALTELLLQAAGEADDGD